MPHVNAVAKTYEMPFPVKSHLTGHTINRFNHIHQGVDDLVAKVKMLRVLNQQTGCCIQRCAGMDALNATYIVTYEIDKKYGTNYHERFKKFLTYVQDYNLVVLGRHDRRQGRPEQGPHPAAGSRPVRPCGRGAGRTASWFAAPRPTSPACPAATR